MTIWFYAQTDPYAEFSDFAPFGVEMAGAWWPTVEHAFQASKFAVPAHRERIRRAGPPTRAKALGLGRDVPIRPDWDAARDGVMPDALRVKFRTHPGPRDLLLSTGAQEIVANAPDAHWGRGPDGQGLNRLGALPMRVRSELHAAS